TESTRITPSSHLSAEEAHAGAARQFGISDRARNAQLDLGSRPGAGPDVQLGSDLGGALAHSAQTVMAGFAFFQVCRRNAGSIVPNTNPKHSRVIGDFGFYLLRSGVAESIM